jgi:hypothetical protein
MSITKNTRRRKKVAPRNTQSASPANPQAKPRYDVKYVEKYAGLGVVHEEELYQFILNVPLAELRAYGGRFHLLMEALEMARQQPSIKTRRAVIKLIAMLEKESRNQQYSQFLQAIAAAAQSREGASRAYWTAARVVEMTFEWTSEYLFAFSLYKQQLKQVRQPNRSAAKSLADL